MRSSTLVLCAIVAACRPGSRATGADSSPSDTAPAPAARQLPAVIHCGSLDDCRTWAHDGTYVDFLAKEINIKILFLSERGCRAREIAEDAFRQVPARSEPQEDPPDGGRGTQTTYPAFSFLPYKLGKIRDFQVRVHVGASCGPHSELDLASAILGASSVVLAATSDPFDYRSLLQRVVSSPAYFPRTPIVLFVEDPNPAAVQIENKAIAQVIPTTPGNRKELFEAVKAAVKVALEKMKEGRPAGEVASRPVAILPLVELLRDAEKAKGRPLMKDETIDVRDRARFVNLELPRAAEVEKKRGYTDIDPDRVWEEWQEVRRKQTDDQAPPH